MVRSAECWNREVIRPLVEPLQAAGSGTAVLRGNLAPSGAVVKQSAASPGLLRHTGRAVVFDTPRPITRSATTPTSTSPPTTSSSSAAPAPRGYPGMPEVANVPIPTKLLRAGVTDMVRICDGRMSGTGYGTVVLHVAPESAVGGPLAFVRTGDTVTLDVAARALTLDVDDDELERRRVAWKPPEPVHGTGYGWLYTQHVLQADRGADFDFMVGSRGAGVPRESH